MTRVPLSVPSWMILVALAAPGCAAESPPGSPPAPVEDDNLEGVTALAAVINPVLNVAHATGAPSVLGSERDGIPVDANPGSATTSEAGLATVSTGVGAVELHIGNGLLGHPVPVAGDVYDAAIAYNGASASYFSNVYTRYPIGEASGVAVFGPSDALAEVGAELAQDDAVVVLRAGTYAGDLTITGSNTFLVADPLAEQDVVIDGSVTVTGKVVRLRGLTITGDLVANGDGFGLTFSTVKGQALIDGDGDVFLRDVFCGLTNMAAASLTLLDCFGSDPIPTPPAGACD
ncbi:hypothetical protein [Polyangium aurulentum]|uniref:hypothetical protein n=1 Tax=Polyangium aurulentum TaxID=2567896 RepID=UPI0010AE1C44|nr:hypothetical protein [Polyangium aurulentum]UQA56332.1 hypothetical protein E8A73_034200 [Polyangium aurulentum]